MKDKLTRIDVEITLASGGSLEGESMSELDLSGVDFQKASLRGCDLRYANMSHVNLEESDLSGANIGGAVLSESNLTGAFFRKSDLRWSILLGVTAVGADFSDAGFLESRLSFSNFTLSLIHI